MLDWKYRPDREKQTTPGPGTLPATEEPIREETPEGFTSRNVKTITFVVCISLFLLLFGPVSIFRIVNRNKDHPVEGEQICVEDVIRLSGKKTALTMADLRRYSGRVNENKYRIYYYIEFDHYMLLGVEEKETGLLEVCLIRDDNTGDEIDLREDNAKAFFETH